MLKKNEYIVFSSTGVCEVVDIVTKNFEGDTVREYYVLNPLRGNGSTIYIPTDNKTINIRRIMTREQSQKLIESYQGVDDSWNVEDSPRRTAFANALQSGDPERLMELIKTLYARQANLTEQGKKLSNSDTDTLKMAEQLLYDELSYSLDIDLEEVPALIFGKPKANEV